MSHSYKTCSLYLIITIYNFFRIFFLKFNVKNFSEIKIRKKCQLIFFYLTIVHKIMIHKIRHKCEQISQFYNNESEARKRLRFVQMCFEGIFFSLSIGNDSSTYRKRALAYHNETIYLNSGNITIT